MSARELRRSARDGNVRRSSRRNGLEVDLNDIPPPDETSGGGGGGGGGDGLQEAQASERATAVPVPPLPAAIDVEAIDDEVVISSPRSFAEARNKSRRNRGVTVVLDDDAEGQGITVERSSRFTLNNNKKRRRVPTSQATNFELFINVEGIDNVKRANSGNRSPPSQSVPPPKEPSFNCPVCMCQLTEETSTKCGHIFCKKCIKASIAAQSKCPTCRRKLSIKDTFRVYLPTTG